MGRKKGRKREGGKYKLSDLLLLSEENDCVTDAAHEEHDCLEDPELPLLHPFHLRKRY